MIKGIRLICMIKKINYLFELSYYFIMQIMHIP